MKVSRIKGWFMVGVSGLVILAMVVLVTLQWGNQAQFSLYGQNRTVNTMALMALSIAAGVVLVGVFGVLLRGIRTLRGRAQGG